MQALILSLYKNFLRVLMERLPDVSIEGKLQSGHSDAMAIDVEDASAMEVEKENGKPVKRFVWLIFFLFPFLDSLSCNDKNPS